MAARKGPQTSGPAKHHSAVSECPVEPEAQRWLESSLRWFVDEFGTAVLHRDPVLPSNPFLAPQGYCASADQVEALVARCCELMMVDRQLISLELFDGAAEKKQAAMTGRSRSVGHFRIEDGRAIIALDQSEAADPKLLIAIAVHELCHLRLLGERRIQRDRSDGERLTDLLTVYFGFGIFATNAAMRFARADRGWSLVPLGELDDITLNAARREGYNRLGYLSSAEFGYALACYCWLRSEKDPGWAKYVNPGPLLHLKQGLAFLMHSSVAGELPTQRLLGQSVQIGSATVRITRGKRIGPALLGLIVADGAAGQIAGAATRKAR
jgi:hypothetical protein